MTATFIIGQLKALPQRTRRNTEEIGTTGNRGIGNRKSEGLPLIRLMTPIGKPKPLTTKDGKEHEGGRIAVIAVIGKAKAYR